MFHISATWCTVLVGHSCLKMNCVKSNLILVLRFFPTVKQFAVCQMGRNMMTHAQSEVPMWTAYEGITLSTTWFLPQEATACCEEYIDPFMTVLVADARANILDSRDTPGPQDVSCASKWYLDIPRLAFIWKTFWRIISNWFYAFNIVCISANNANSSSFSMFFSRNFASERRATHVMFNQQVVAYFICKQLELSQMFWEIHSHTHTHSHAPSTLTCLSQRDPWPLQFCIGRYWKFMSQCSGLYTLSHHASGVLKCVAGGHGKIVCTPTLTRQRYSK